MSRFSTLLFLWATAAALHAQTFTTLHSFNGTDGSEPLTGLVQSTNGDLYGTTYTDGAINGGTIFKITVSGELHSFGTLPGFCSGSGLVQGTDGDLYGTCAGGGAHLDGFVFKITPSGTLTTLYSFCSQAGCADGGSPFAGLVQGTNGDFYGTTFTGGANNNGTVFKIAPSGTLTTLYSFCSQPNCADGNALFAGLVQGTDGDLYGTTYGGGTNDNGTVFRITPSGTLTTLYRFCSKSACADGAGPLAGLVQDGNGNFYGTTIGGGANGYGTVFKITPSGSETVLYSFTGTGGDGANPYKAPLVRDAQGNLYGTTYGGGSSAYGTVFKVTTGGRETVLHSFDLTDGAFPQAGLVQDTNGNFYGTTSQGGANGYGTVFSVSVGLGPFVSTLPASGRVGVAVTILGSNLTGATGVSFNGTAASFKEVSSSEITTTVPSGATTGTVKVVTPGGTLSSNVPFQVH